MRFLSLDETAAYLEAATIEQSIDKGHCFVHIGLNAMGGKFVMMNDAQGDTVVTEPSA